MPEESSGALSDYAWEGLERSIPLRLKIKLRPTKHWHVVGRARDLVVPATATAAAMRTATTTAAA
jgi:hypothetical protein